MSDSLPPFDPRQDYPVAERRPDLVTTPSGRRLSAVTLAAVIANEIAASDLRITLTALELQADVAAASGRPALTANFARAAELTRVPDDRLLEIYEALRPRRSTARELAAIAAELETQYAAPLTARLVREAADAYARRDLLPPDQSA